jgi:hypothetical protein
VRCGSRYYRFEDTCCLHLHLIYSEDGCSKSSQDKLNSKGEPGGLLGLYDFRGSIFYRAGLSNAAPMIYFPGALIYSAGFNVNQNFKKENISE